MRFCPACGASVERRLPDGDTVERDVCTTCATIHYHNPKVVVGSVCTWDDRVLLCRRAIEPRAGFWTVPAGYLELGETTEEGASREAWEEATADLEITALLGIYDVVRIGQVQLFFRANLLSPDVAAGIETQELDLFEWGAIPWSELAFPSVTWILERALERRGQTGPFAPARGP